MILLFDFKGGGTIFSELVLRGDRTEPNFVETYAHHRPLTFNFGFPLPISVNRKADTRFILAPHQRPSFHWLGLQMLVLKANHHRTWRNVVPAVGLTPAVGVEDSVFWTTAAAALWHLRDVRADY